MNNSKSKRSLPKLIIGVVTFNNQQNEIEQLSRSISFSVENISHHQIEAHAYIIDNGEASTWPELGIKLIGFDSAGNVGFGNAMNVLMSAAFSDPATQWFLCVNPDGVFHYKALNELLSKSVASPNSLIEARQFPEEHPKEYDPETLETSWASGACLLIPRAVYETIGGFDPNFFMYLEDADYSWRARAAGFSIKFAPQALFGHSVLGRIPDQKHFLLSARYLGFKWRNAGFVNRMEKELIKRGLFSARSELPPLPKSDIDAKTVDPSMADFKHHYYFAPGRW